MLRHVPVPQAGRLAICASADAPGSRSHRESLSRPLCVVDQPDAAVIHVDRREHCRRERSGHAGAIRTIPDDRDRLGAGTGLPPVARERPRSATAVRLRQAGRANQPGVSHAGRAPKPSTSEITSTSEVKRNYSKQIRSSSRSCPPSPIPHPPSCQALPPTSAFRLNRLIARSTPSAIQHSVNATRSGKSASTSFRSPFPIRSST